ncbi:MULTISPECIES: hypothetical protein [Pseudomonas]|uniref:hypothetical protein n=1 Tax=Pseudomonas TaxID=286 RepID=UPI001AE3D208|nr:MULTISPECIES: hypothetical protein [unclassified Pseudomonas]WQG56919.1 hypothetical protein RHM66_16545 [Pseudomonas sp. RTB3]MBP1125807.1 hypothetical protein [Pseudomonas sp. PvP025]MDQ0399666.1 hypothetical protein [Pseudomonas sp. PvP006]MEB0108958.1 hypothetical protein [Pseudomonas sp. MH9.3]WPX81447.1 hypothetical protein RHM60_10170 [Pseudomonas sp. MH9.3]
MLVNNNTQAVSNVQQVNRPDMDPANAAASTLYSGVLAATQPALTLPAAQKDLDKASGRIDEAFAKTRVQLQASAPASGTRAELTEYMSKSPGERIREQLLKEQGLTEEQAQALPQEKQDAISREVAARLKEQQQVASTTAPAEPVKQALAAL